jgi:uncharacterized protein YihD (DUF1040 family)
MVSKAIIGSPITVEFEDAAVWKELKECSGFGADLGDDVPSVDVTHLGSDRKEYIDGMKDGAEFDFRFALLQADDADQQRFRALARQNADVPMRVTLPDTRDGVTGEVHSFTIHLLREAVVDPTPDGKLELSVTGRLVSDITVT